ncbi:FAD-binding oxidoreductase [Mameliella sediminis]|uniref:FAD-binding oxidoreductase n=1 Tax=Mameliella sediminis TaxID=2836866 RepID=UPI001C45B2A2|nr:FAD-binding oxidoreductase [Mameliella sediminis]MBV7396575.1 FAD-binding oxidoreductase [Mameliella sediminis]MBY6162864.1 FAD-binding oxidoreductase [Mameliella alba]MBY6171128.1 FAD-binding oxidoreductase [Mameliella alba]MBY6176352.1 FAD-binding oxidoreductase [Mameliella alba]
MTTNWDQAAFTAALDGIRVHDDENYLAARSQDYFWYSPILNEQLKDLRGELLVMPQTVEEVMHVAALVARHKVPLTLRGGGTGNYGQCVPMEGGVIMDLTRLSKVIEITPGHVTVEAGARISRLDDAVRETGQELLMYPSTRQMATIGGFLAGGSGGIGSLRHGMLRDPGNVTHVKVVTVEPEPRIIELHGDEIQKVQHAYGTNGIVVELGLTLTQATEWIHTAALFDGYDRALEFATKAQSDGLDCYLLTAVERRFAPYYRKFGDLFPEDRDAIFAMVAPEEMERFKAEAERMGGRISFAMTKPEIRDAGLQPAYECGWNHTTLQALKVDKGWTYLQVAYPRPFDPDLVMKQMARYGDEIFWHHEMARMDGEIQIFALPLVRYRGKDETYRLIRELEDTDGCTIFDPHVVTIEDGGMKEIDDTQIAFKKLADPYGLMNPGKTRGWSADMARKD